MTEELENQIIKLINNKNLGFFDIIKVLDNIRLHYRQQREEETGKKRW